MTAQTRLILWCAVVFLAITNWALVAINLVTGDPVRIATMLAAISCTLLALSGYRFSHNKPCRANETRRDQP